MFRCPTCNRPVEWNPNSQWRPFCSERCKLIDLGAWASERHVISDEAKNTDQNMNDSTEAGAHFEKQEKPK